jgi:hypothetical protein
MIKITRSYCHSPLAAAVLLFAVCCLLFALSGSAHSLLTNSVAV